MKSVNTEEYKIIKTYFNNGNANVNPNNTATNIRDSEKYSKYHVTKIEEKLKLTQKYRLKWAIDPMTGQKYTIADILSLNLIDKNTTNFYIPSTRRIVALDEAIRCGIVFADLIDEYLETSNESYEYIQQSHSPPPVIINSITNPIISSNVLPIKVQHSLKNTHFKLSFLVVGLFSSL